MERPNPDENPIHFKCLSCGYIGTSDELTEEHDMFYCPICDSDIEWE